MRGYQYGECSIEVGHQKIKVLQLNQNRKRLIKNSITSEKTQNLKTPSSSLPHKTSLKHDSKVSDTSYKQNKKNCVNKKMLSVSDFKCLNLVQK